MKHFANALSRPAVWLLVALRLACPTGSAAAPPAGSDRGAVVLPPLTVQAVEQAPPPAALDELTVEGLVAEVLARNPSLAQMAAAYEAAAARYPQVTSLDDPTLGFTGAPTAIGDRALV